MNDACRHCGEPESAHHKFIPEREMLPGCVCDPIEWPDYIAMEPICGQFESYSGHGFCRKCEHDEGCHSGVTI